MERVLVTGAAGYVGREVVRRLLASGKKVTGLARNRANPECDSIRADLADAPSLARALANRAFDSILHLASLPGDTGDPQQMVAVNVTGFLNLLEYARRAGAGRVVLASSISAYGWYPGTRFDPPDFLPVREEHPCRPKDIYSTSKRAQELLAMTYQHQYGVPASVLRPWSARAGAEAAAVGGISRSNWRPAGGFRFRTSQPKSSAITWTIAMLRACS